MMTKCPECGSSEVVPDLIVFADAAAICGACDHTQFYTKQHAEILEAYKKSYTSQTYGLKIIPNL